mmetsp:Transcript_1912/g.7188  ORF Transcript_1912/g.7188 Transcript_1912/m.7188 type:complete len:465 (-) Transcript_1912:39-1433(-)
MYYEPKFSLARRRPRRLRNQGLGVWHPLIREHPLVPPLVHRDALAAHPPGRRHDGRGVVEVQIRVRLLERLGRLLRVVVRDGVVDVVRHVGASDAVVQKVVDGPVRAVDGHERALDQVPLVPLEVGHVHVGVLQPGVQHEPEVAHQIGPEVQRRDGPDGTRRNRPRGERTDRGDDADVALPHLAAPLAREQGVLALVARVGVEVVRGSADGAARRSREEVDWPTQEEDADEVEGREGPLAEHVAELEHHVAVGGVDLRRDVGLALHHVVRARVVHRVRSLPREIRDEEQGVEDVPHGVLDGAVIGEGAVAALVRHDPAPGTGGPGDEGVRDPRGEVGERHGDVGESGEAEADGDGGGNRGVHEGLGGVLDEAVLGDLVQYLGHGGKLLLLRVERLTVHAGVVLLRRVRVTRRGRDGAGGDRRGDDDGALRRGATGAWRNPERDATGGGFIAGHSEGARERETRG